MSINQTPTISILVNGEAIHVGHDCTIVDLLAKLRIHSRAIAIELNQEILPTDQFNIQLLRSGDRLEIVTLVGGG